MTCHSNGDYLIGIDYEAIDDLHGHFTIRRCVPLQELIEELSGFILNGHHYPQFPPQANPEIAYAYDLNNQEDADIYDIINNKLIKELEWSYNGQNMVNYKTDNR